MTKSDYLRGIIVELAARYEGGESLASLGSNYGCNPGLVYTVLLEFGVEVKKRQNFSGCVDDYSEEIKAMCEAGVSCNQIAKNLGISKPAILRFFKKNGLESIQKQQQKKDVASLDVNINKMIEEYLCGVSITELMSKYSWGRAFITNKLKAKGIEVRQGTAKPKPPEGYRICSKCEQMKLLEEFYKNSTIKDGYDYRCKGCKRTEVENNKEHYAKYKKEHYQKNKEKYLNIAKEKREANPEEYNKSRREQYHKNKGPLQPKKVIDNFDEIVSLYNSGLTLNEVAAKFDCHSTSIIEAMERRGIKRRPKKKYHCNENFFEKIDDKYKAWILGWWYTDGNVGQKHPNLILRVTDEEIPVKIKEMIGFDGPISVTDRSDSGRKTIYSLLLRSEKLRDDIVKLGCPPKKTYILTFPSFDIVPFELMPYFLRGALEGDGCIRRYSKEYRWVIDLTGTKDFVTGAGLFLQNRLEINFRILKATKRNNDISVLRITGHRQINKVLNYIYCDGEPVLTRKYLKYKAFLAEFAERSTL